MFPQLRAPNIKVLKSSNFLSSNDAVVTPAVLYDIYAKATPILGACVSSEKKQTKLRGP
jgi:hypothetical protein